MTDEPNKALLPVKRAAVQQGEITPLNEDDREVMNALREVLVRFDAVDRFGITLLHDHFDIAEDEYLLETNDPVSRSLEIRPHSGELPDGTVETAWRFSRQHPDAQGILYCRGEWYWDHSTNPPTHSYRHWAR